MGERSPTVVVPTDVMHDEQQHEFVCSGPYQGHPQRQLVRQIEWPAELVARQCLDLPLAFAFGELGQIMASPTDLNVIGEDLIWLALAVHPVGGAQDCMARDEIVESGA